MLKSVMADAKKGDSFMRQNRIKKVSYGRIVGAFDTVPHRLRSGGKASRDCREYLSGGGEGRQSDLLSGEYF